MAVSSVGLICVHNFLRPAGSLWMDWAAFVLHSREVWGEAKGPRCSCREPRCFASSPVEGRSRECQLHLRPSRTGKTGLNCKPDWWQSDFPRTTRETGTMIVLAYLTHRFLLVGLLVLSDRKYWGCSNFLLPFRKMPICSENSLLFTEPTEESSTRIVSPICVYWGWTALSFWLKQSWHHYNTVIV